MKRLLIFILVICFLLTACSSAPKSKAEPASTPMKAAKTFVQALTTGDEALLNTVIYHSQSMPANEIMNIATMRKITGMEQSDFTYTKDPEEKDTVIVSFKDSEGQQDTWHLVFIKNDKGNKSYQYDGYLSGTLMANSTLEATTKSYLKSLINFNADLLYNLSEYRPAGGGYGQAEAKEYVLYYGINKKKLNDFNISRDGKLGGNDQIKISYTGKNKQTNMMFFYISKGKDGYYVHAFSAGDPRS